MEVQTLYEGNIPAAMLIVLLHQPGYRELFDEAWADLNHVYLSAIKYADMVEYNNPSELPKKPNRKRLEYPAFYLGKQYADAWKETRVTGMRATCGSKDGFYSNMLRYPMMLDITYRRCSDLIDGCMQHWLELEIRFHQRLTKGLAKSNNGFPAPLASDFPNAFADGYVEVGSTNTRVTTRVYESPKYLSLDGLSDLMTKMYTRPDVVECYSQVTKDWLGHVRDMMCADSILMPWSIYRLHCGKVHIRPINGLHLHSTNGVYHTHPIDYSSDSLVKGHRCVLHYSVGIDKSIVVTYVRM